MSAVSTQLSERQREILRRVVEEYVATGQPVGSKTLVERAGLRRLVLDRARRARRARAARAAHAPAHLGRARARPRPATASTSTSCSRGRSRARSEFPLELADRARRGRRGAPGDDRDALAGDAAARARLGAAARGGDGPPRRGAAAAAERRDGRRDHVDRRGHEAALRRSRSRSTRASSPGPATTCGERLAGVRLRSRLLRAGVRRAGPLAARAGVPRRDPRRLRRRRGRAAALRRRRRGPARRPARRRRSAPTAA